MPTQVTPPSDLKVFFSAISDSARKAMWALSAAESLTDEVAVQVAQTAGLKDDEAGTFVRALHFADFVVERNSEWHFASPVRSYLAHQLIEESDLGTEVHSLLLDIANKALPSDVGEIVPRYLVSDVGRAYHIAALSPSQGLKLYSEAAKNERSGSQWLLARLAIEQQQLGVLPKDAIEPPFLEGMTLYREGRPRQAERYLQRVIRSKETRREVAIACHIVGLLRDDEGLLRRSLKQLESLDDRIGQAQVLHTLGQLIGRDRKRVAEAENLLRKSLSIEDRLDYGLGVAKVQHTLGQLVGRDPTRSAEAEDLLRKSLRFDEGKPHEHHRSQVLNTLGQLVGRDPKRGGEAEDLLSQGLRAAKARKDVRSQAQVLHTIAQVIARDPKRVTEAEDLLRSSLELGKELKDRNHQAQVLFTLGKLLWPADQAESEKLLQKSLLINKQRGATWAVNMVQAELAKKLSKK